MAYNTPYNSIPADPAVNQNWNERHELTDFYDSSSIPAPHRLSQNLQSYSPSPSQSYTSLPHTTDPFDPPMSRPTTGYRDSYASSSQGDKEMSGFIPGTGDGAGLSAAMGYTAWDPQGKSGARFAAAREEMDRRDGNGSGQGGSGFGSYAAGGAAAGASRKKFWWILGSICLVVAAVIGVAVGVVVSKRGNGGSSGNSSGNSSTGNGTLAGGEANIGSDPSVFTKDDRLHNSFWGFAYTPQNVQYGSCAPSQANITRDIQLLSQLTTRLRLYGANCNQTAMVLQAIQDTKVDMSIYVAIYVDSNTDAYTSQVEAVEDALKTYGTDHVLGVTVGNEYILNNPTTGVAKITGDVTSVNTTIKGLALSKTLPIGTSDAGSMMTAALAQGIDYFHANVHPWFGSVPIDQAADWTNTYFQENDVAVAQSVSNQPACAIAETGWPTASDWTNATNNGATGSQGDASVANLQTFLDTFVCAANTNGTDYFYFEAFDEPWKVVFGGVEPYWGLFDSNRNLKDVTIPNCSHN